MKDLGDGSARVARLKPGTRALVEGPYGKLTGETYTGGPVLMLACGIGITPLLALLGELPYRPGEATLVYRARNEAEVAFRRRTGLAGPAARRADRLPARPAGRSAVVAAASLAGLGDVEALRRFAPQVGRLPGVRLRPGRVDRGGPCRRTQRRGP